MRSAAIPRRRKVRLRLVSVTPLPEGARDLRTLFFGDSFVAGVGDPDGLGWVGRLVGVTFATGVPMTAYNLGVRRDTSADVRARWRAEAAARVTRGSDCRLVLSFGANDATWESGVPRVPSEQSVENLSCILAGAHQLGLPTLVVGPAPANDVAQHERISALSQAFAICAGRHAVEYIDVVDALRADPTWAREAQAGDGAHPGPAGYERLARLVIPRWLSWISPAL